MRVRIYSFVAVALAVLALAGCSTPLSDSITNSDRKAYEAACNKVHGAYTNSPIPSCNVEYDYPAPIEGGGQ